MTYRFIDVDVPRLVLIGFGVATAIVLLVAASTSMAAFSAYNFGWEGTSELRTEADAVGATSTVLFEADEYESLEPEETVVVVHSPDSAYESEESGAVRRFVHRGGTLVVTEDFGPYSDPLLESVGANSRFQGGLLRDEFTNRGNSTMPVVETNSTHSYVDGVSELTLNHGTAVDPHGSTVLASTSRFSYRDVNRNGYLDRGETIDSHPVITVEEIGRGQVIVVGDPSLFINSMLDHSDNRAFIHQIFDGHNTVAFDHSHTDGVPPGIAAMNVLRSSAILQSIGGGVAIAAVILWAMWPTVETEIRTVIDRSERSDSQLDLRAEDVAEFLRERHPDWNAERVKRVVSALIENRRR